MKKNLSISLLFMLSLSLASCENNVSYPVTLSIGENISSNENAQLTEINRYANFKNKIESNESFLLVVYDNLGCMCYIDFKNILEDYIFENNLVIYQITDTLLEDQNTYGINLDVSYPSLVLFDNGQLAFQENYNADLATSIFNDFDELNNFLKDKIDMPKIIKLKKEEIEETLHLDEEMIVYFGRESCPDCRSYTSNVLYKYIDETTFKNNIPFYYIDTGMFEDEQEWKNIKDLYGISDLNNTLGYGDGYVPSIQYRKNKKVVDMDVFLNDLYEELPYYNQNTLELHGFLNNNKEYVLENNQSDSYYLEKHIEISKLFLKTYFN